MPLNFHFPYLPTHHFRNQILHYFSATKFHLFEAPKDSATMIQRTLFSRSLLRSFCLRSQLSSSSFSKLGGGSHGDASRLISSFPEPCRSSPCSDDESCDIDWDSLGFGLVPTDYMYVMKCSKDENFERGHLSRYGNIELSPSAGVLNYGQGLFEGLKAYRKEDGGLLLFRPHENALRLRIGAERMCMVPPSIEQFVDAVKQTVIANRRWVPPPGKGSLYLRPLLIGTGPVLGLAPAPDYTFLIYASPVRNYFKEGSAPLNLYVEKEFDRASRGGTGGVKAISNYAPVLKAITNAKRRGFSDVLYLDSVNKRNLEEVSSCNIFIVKGNVISTPATNGTILPGITRKSIIDIACDRGYEVEERAIDMEELFDAREVFCTGTAVGVAPVGSITCMDRRIEYETGPGSTCQELYSTLVGIQNGTIEDKMGWTVEIS